MASDDEVMMQQQANGSEGYGSDDGGPKVCEMHDLFKHYYLGCTAVQLLGGI